MRHCLPSALGEGELDRGGENGSGGSGILAEECTSSTRVRVAARRRNGSDRAVKLGAGGGRSLGVVGGSYSSSATVVARLSERETVGVDVLLARLVAVAGEEFLKVSLLEVAGGISTAMS